MLKQIDNNVLIQVWHTANQLETDEELLSLISEELQLRGLGVDTQQKDANVHTVAETLVLCGCM